MLLSAVVSFHFTPPMFAQIYAGKGSNLRENTPTAIFRVTGCDAEPRALAAE